MIYNHPWARTVLTLFLMLCIGWTALGDNGSPIIIEGDAELASFPGIMGDGSEMSPFIIEGLLLDASTEGCLEIRNTQAHLIIRDCRMSRAVEAALVLTNTANVWVVQSIFENNATAVMVSPESTNIILTLNTFRGNERDIEAAPASVQLDDGYAGNWWEQYDGTDENGDGIGNLPFQPANSDEVLEDRMPLVVPYVDEEELEQGVFRLELEHTAGQVIEWVEKSVSEISMVIGSLSMTTDMEMEMTYRDEVLSAPGTGIYSLRQTVIADTGRASADGIPQQYVSSIGTLVMPVLHRFGGLLSAGDMPGEDASATGVAAQLIYPVRPIAVGHTWTGEWILDAEALGIPNGEAIYKGSYMLDRIEEWEGKTCAVISAYIELDGSGAESDPYTGSIEYVATGATDSIFFVDLAGGRIVRQSMAMDVDISMSSSGTPMGQMEMVISSDSHDILTEDAPEISIAEHLALLREEIDGLLESNAELEETVATLASQSELMAPLRVAYVDAEAVFAVFVSAVGDLRQRIIDKNNEIINLTSEYTRGDITADEYEQRSLVLDAELLEARVATATGTLDRMIASDDFSDLRSALVTLREEGQPLIDEVSILVAMIREEAIHTIEFQNQYETLSAIFGQFDGYVTSAATTKLVQATEKVALEQGYDLVVRKKNVIMYRNPTTIDDITDLVRAEIADYL